VIEPVLTIFRFRSIKDEYLKNTKTPFKTLSNGIQLLKPSLVDLIDPRMKDGIKN